MRIKYHSLLSIHAVLAGSDAHLAKASSSLIGGYSSLNTLEKHGRKQKCKSVNESKFTLSLSQITEKENVICC